jgi:hypothetical protein
MRAALLGSTAIRTSLAGWFYAWISRDYIPHGQGKRRAENRARRAARPR